jgi:N-methylhydantoinase B
VTETAAGSPPLDGASVEIIRSYLTSAAEQMRRALVRSAFNPVIYEVLDFGISMYDADLELIAEAPGITSFLGANDYGIRKGVSYVGAGRLQPGDVVLMNYPYWSGAHVYDALLFAPAFHDGTLAAYVAVRAHWLDLGAKAPGYVLDSTEMHQEGLIFPGTKIVKGGVVDDEIIELVRFNSRLPETVIGDFYAQLAAIRTGERRLHEIWEKFGFDTVQQAQRLILDHGERLTREALARLPDGTWTATDWLDDDCISDDLIGMRVTITIAGDSMVVDFDGSSAAVTGPVNIPFGATESLGKAVLKGMTTPSEPANAGHYRPLTVRAEEGSLFHAVYPAATFTLWSQIVAFELLHKALAQGVGSIPASSGGDEPGFMAVGFDPRTSRDFVISNNEGIGWGAGRDHDGANAQQHLSQSVVRNTPVEVLEQRAPLLHHRVELVPDSGGAGRYRGGVGVRREVEMLAPCEVLSMKKKTKTSPWSLAGGHESEPSFMRLWPGTPAERRVGMHRASMALGDRFVNVTAGGGGWGDPLTRAAELVLADVRDGYVSAAAARGIYGIDVAGDGSWTPTPARVAAGEGQGE